VRGVSALSRALDGVPPGDVSVIVIWEPVIATDRGAPGRSVTRLLEHDATLLWDTELAGSKAMVRAAMKQPERVPPGFGLDESTIIWDLVATWPPGALWDDDPPMPDWFGTTVVDAEDVLALKLDPTMRAEIATTWPQVNETMSRQGRRFGPGVADAEGFARTRLENLELMKRVALAGDEAQRAQAVGWLGGYDAETWLDVLQRADHDTSPAVRLAAISARASDASRHFEKDVSPLLPALEDASWDVRFKAARELARREDHRVRAVDVLAPGLRSKDSGARFATSQVLRSAGLPGTRALEAVVFDESATLQARVEAVRALREAWSHPDLEAPDRILARAARLPDPELAVAAVAARGVRDRAPPEAIADLIRMTDSSAESARLMALEALGSLDEDAVFLIGGARGSPEEHERDAALGGIAVKQWSEEWRSAAIPALQELTRSSRPETREWASRALDILHAPDEQEQEQARETDVR
jgi:HEAT repeat protein